MCLAAFGAGFVDAIAGGGGLIQVPVGLVLLRFVPVATVIGTLKFPAFCGTSLACLQYSKHVLWSSRRIFIFCLVAFCSALAGSYALTCVSNSFVKPLVFVILVFVAFFTFIKKNTTGVSKFSFSEKKSFSLALGLCLLVGFYDGFVGPGTGSFLLFGFILILGLDFLNASAQAKFVNLATNFASIIIFLLRGHVLFSLALPMCFFNAMGGYLGARVAIKKGNHFVRLIFLMVVFGTLIRLAFDIVEK